jgi:hypothetical protein
LERRSRFERNCVFGIGLFEGVQDERAIKVDSRGWEKIAAQWPEGL